MALSPPSLHFLPGLSSPPVISAVPQASRLISTHVSTPSLMLHKVLPPAPTSHPELCVGLTFQRSGPISTLTWPQSLERQEGKRPDSLPIPGPQIVIWLLL